LRHYQRQQQHPLHSLRREQTYDQIPLTGIGVFFPALLGLEL
jgi:hypothetical protein